tara:strand:- start:251 stop:784 length:534 start_codon:yes stop_codon:yes gene_type:complete
MNNNTNFDNLENGETTITPVGNNITKIHRNLNYNGLDICTMVVFLFLLVGGFITYIVFTIIGLGMTSNDTVLSNCPGSTLWIFVIVSMVMGILNVGINSITDNYKSKKTLRLIIGLVISVAMTSWGSYEIWENSCNKKHFGETILYQIANACVIINIIALSLIFIAIFCTVYFTSRR